MAAKKPSLSIARPPFMAEDPEAPELAAGLQSDASGWVFSSEASFKTFHAYRIDTMRLQSIAAINDAFTRAKLTEFPLFKSTNVLRITVEVIDGDADTKAPKASPDKSDDADTKSE